MMYCWIMCLDYELDMCAVVECPLKFAFEEKSAISAILYGKTENHPKFTFFQKFQARQYNLKSSTELNLDSMNAILSL